MPSGRLFKLAHVELCVETTLGEQLFVRALLDYIAVSEHEDEVCILDGTEPVSYDKARAVAGERVHGAL